MKGPVLARMARLEERVKKLAVAGMAASLQRQPRKRAGQGLAVVKCRCLAGVSATAACQEHDEALAGDAQAGKRAWQGGGWVEEPGRASSTKLRLGSARTLRRNGHEAIPSEDPWAELHTAAGALTARSRAPLPRQRLRACAHMVLLLPARAHD